jgi:hypothetical protein
MMRRTLGFAVHLPISLQPVAMRRDDADLTRPIAQQDTQ